MRARLVVAILPLILSGCLEENAGATPTATPTNEVPAYECKGVKSFKMADVNATIETTKGSIGIVLYGAKSPITVCNFLRYVEENFYDATMWHRVCTHVIQAGGFNPYTNEQKKGHEPIKNEANQSQLRNYKYTLGMARSNDPDSASTHFYINVKDNTYLDWDGQYAPGYAVFGNVTSGQSVVDEIQRTPIVPDPPSQGCNGKPLPSMETTIRDVKVAA